MARKTSTMTGWIKRRARQFMREFHTPRHKAVRCAAEDWQALQGGRRVTALDLGRGSEQDHLPGVSVPVPGHPQRRTTGSMKGFRFYLSGGTGGRA